MQFFDGGAFADCPYIQYPHGMGKLRAPATVVAAATAAAKATGSMSSSVRATSDAYASSSFLSSTNKTATRDNVMQASSSRAVALVSASVSTLDTSASAHAAQKSTETAEETTARTAKSLQDSLHATRRTTEVFDGRSLALQSRNRAAASRPSMVSKTLSIVVSEGEGVAGARESDPGPIVRSPTKEKKSIFTDALLLRSDGGKKEGTSGGAVNSASSAASFSSSAMVAAVEGDAMGGSISSGTAAAAAAAANSRKVVVPFCVSSWQNRKKLIVPVEQRLAQQHDDRLDSEAGMGDAIIDLAVAMQQASKEVAAEMAAKEKARAEEEERRQAALEAAEAEKARQLLEQKAAELAANAQRRETREQRLERIRLERELREQEKLAKQEQRLRERAAARLNITVEDLEADAQLLRTLEEATTRVGGTFAGSTRRADAAGTSSSMSEATRGATSASGIAGQVSMEGDDDVDEMTGGRRKPAVRGGVFASAVISNEGIRREMDALAAVEAHDGTQQQQQQQHDGIRIREENENSADEDVDEDGDGGDFQLQNFMTKKKQRL